MNETIKQALAQYDEVEAQLRSSLPNTSEYVINGIWDDDGYKAAKSALRTTKQLRSSIEAKRKELKAIALEYGRAVDGKAKELTEIVNEPIGDLESKIAAIDNEKERLRNERRNERTKELTAAGYEFSAGAYRVGAEIVHPTAIDDADDDDWQRILERGAKAKAEQEERQRKEAEERERLLKVEQENARLRRELEQAQRMAAQEPEPQPKPAPAPEPEPAPQPKRSESYEAGFSAAQTLAIEIVGRAKTRKDMLDEISVLKP